MPDPCAVVVFLVVAHLGTWDFAPWCVHRGGGVVWGLWPAPIVVTIAGMSWNWRWVFVGVLVLLHSGASVVDFVVALGTLRVVLRLRH